MPRPRRRVSHGLLLGAVLVLLLAAALAPPFDQPEDFNHWADNRVLLGIPHFGDVVSNLGFLLVGILGLFALGKGKACIHSRSERLAWTLVFLGLLLTAVGSSYYHWEPTNARLTWDRLPMALGFMALLGAVIMERVNVKAGLALLPFLILAGWASVLYWYWSTLQGAGDIRPYLLVQVGALALIPLMLWFYPPTYTRGGDYLMALLLYALAMVTEQLDAQIYQWTGVVSGHTVKHLIAALAGYWLLRMLLLRNSSPLT